MAKVEIVRSLFEEINKTFKGKSVKIFEYLKTLETNPKKGKELGSVGGILIKELKFSGYRFYFVTDGFKLKCFREEDLIDLLMKFVRMSNKKYQQKTINEIKHVLRTIGAGGFK